MMRPRRRAQRCRPATYRDTLKVTVAGSESVIKTRAPIAAASAGPDRAARKAGGESPRRVIAGAMLSLEVAPFEPSSAVGGVTVVVVTSAVVGVGVGVGVGSETASNWAWTDRAALMVSVHGSVPEQSPLQPAKLDPLAGLALSVTTEPAV
jgi:hypothetical protein